MMFLLNHSDVIQTMASSETEENDVDAVVLVLWGFEKIPEVPYTGIEIPGEGLKAHNMSTSVSTHKNNHMAIGTQISS